MEEENGPVILKSGEFQNLMLKLTIDTRYFVATQLKEAPKFKGDSATYIVNVLIPGGIDDNSQLTKILKKFSGKVSFLTNQDFPGYVQLVASLFVKSDEQQEKPVAKNDAELQTVEDEEEEEIEMEEEEKPRAKRKTTSKSKS